VRVQGKWEIVEPHCAGETLKREKENVLGETVWFLDKANNITRGRESGR